MEKQREKLLKKNSQVIYALNDLCFGMHGHLSALLKDFNYFLYFRKQSDDEMSNLYLQSLSFDLKKIVGICNLIWGLGGHCKVIEYRNNKVDYYKIKGNCKVGKTQAILDSISSQNILLNNYFRAKEGFENQKVNVVLEKQIDETKKQVCCLNAKMQEGGLKIVNN